MEVLGKLSGATGQTWSGLCLSSGTRGISVGAYAMSCQVVGVMHRPSRAQRLHRNIAVMI